MVSSINKTYHYAFTEILLKGALYTKNHKYATLLIAIMKQLISIKCARSKLDKALTIGRMISLETSIYQLKYLPSNSNRR